MGEKIERVIELYEDLIEEAREVAQRVRERLDDLRARYPDAEELQESRGSGEARREWGGADSSRGYDARAGVPSGSGLPPQGTA